MGSSSSRANKGQGTENIPTPVDFAKAQREFATSHKSVKSDNLSPPTSTKADIFNLDDYTELDEHAKNADLSVAEEGYEALTSYLIQPADSDLGRVRAIYIWMTSQEQEKVLEYFSKHMKDTRNSDTPKETPYRNVLAFFLKRQPELLVDTFIELCRCADIHCQIVKGTARVIEFPQFESPSLVETVSVLVNIEGEWRFLEVARALGLDLEDGNPDRDRKKEVSKQEKEFWFLTDPEKMIFFNYPSKKEHQLLARPATNAEFFKLAKLSPAFFYLGAFDVSQASYYVESEEGNIAFDLQLNNEAQTKFTFDICRSLQDPALNVYDGVSLNNFVTMEQTKEKATCLVEMPWIGKYKLDIFGKTEDQEARLICTYFIICHKPCFYASPNPFQDLELGTTPAIKVLGLEPLSHNTGTIKLDDGALEIVFMITKEGTSFSQTLEGEDTADSSGKDLENSLVRHYIDEDEVTFVLKLRKKGKYLLKLFGYLRNEDAQHFASYLIETQFGCSDFSGMEFPTDVSADLHGTIGNLVTDGGQEISPLSHRKPIIESPRSGDIKIAMKPLLAEISAFDYVLNVHTRGGIEDASCYVLQYTKPDGTVRYYIRFPKAGIYSFEIVAKNSVSGISESKCLYQYVINVKNPKSRCFPIPKFCFWEEGMKVFSPSEGYLQAGKTYTGKFRLPSVTKVLVNEQTYLRKTKKNNWEGEFTVMDDATKLTVFGVFEGEEEAKPLIEYTVLCKEELNSYEEKQERLQQKASNHRRELEKQRKIEEDKVILRKKEQQKALLHREKTFIGKKDEIVKQERQIEKEEIIKRDEKRIIMGDRIKRDRVHLENKDDRNEGNLEENGSNHLKTVPDISEDGPNVSKSESPIEHDSDEESVRRSRTSAGSEDYELGREMTIEELANVVKTRKKGFNYQHPKPLIKESQDGLAAKNVMVGDGDWKKYHENMLPRMALEKVREALRQRDYEALKKALDECQTHGVDEQNEEYVKGRKMQDITLARQDLKQAMDNRDLDGIYNEIDKIEEKKYVKYLQAEVTDAHRQADNLRRLEKLQTVVLDMDKKTMSEVRRYNTAPPILHKVMQGALLLLGEDECTTQDWKNIQKLLNPQGQGGLNRRIMEFDSGKVHPEIAARSKQILQGVKLKDIQAVSAGACTFFIWAMGIIEETEGSSCPESTHASDERVKPANIHRQQEILCRVQPPTHPRRTRYTPGKKSVTTPRNSQARNRRISSEGKSQTSSTSGKV